MIKSETFKPFLLAEAKVHPSMQPRDAVKLCFQSAFGAEHLIADEAAARRYLENEFAETPADASVPLFSRIAENCARVNLAAWKAQNIPLSWLENLFLASAQENAAKSDEEKHASFAEAIFSARELAREGALPFPCDAFDVFWAQEFAEDIHAVHHSDVYRVKEKPAYRIVSGTYVRLLTLFAPLAHLAAAPFPACAAIDGRCASGKSTVGAQLAAITGAGLVHMDDFFPRMETRDPRRLAEPGGNIDYTRFCIEVLPHLRSRRAFSYPTFDCDVMAVRGVREVAGGNLRIVEGSYSHHPYFDGYAALRIFSDIDPEAQMARILIRNGEKSAEMFRTRWIPMEEKYFGAFSIREKADIRI